MERIELFSEYKIFCPKCKAEVKNCRKTSFGKVKCTCTSCGTYFMILGGEGILVVDIEQRPI
jgi:hypothetical protein